MRKWSEKQPHSPARQATEVTCDMETGISQGKLPAAAAQCRLTRFQDVT